MLTPKDDWKNRCAYHPPSTPGVAELHEGARSVIYQAGLSVLNNTTPSREQSLALTKLEEALFWTNAAIARHESPADESTLGASDSS